MTQLTRPTLVAAGLGGALWTAKVLGIIATNGSFDPLESILFLGGLAATLAACVLAAVDLGRRRHGVARVARTAAAAVGIVALTVAVEQIGVSLIGGAYTGGNVGIEDEGGILLAGLAWLAVALSSAWSARSYARSHGQGHEVRSGVA